MDKKQKRHMAILRVVKEGGSSISSARITELLAEVGIDCSERSVRTYLTELEELGFLRSFGRRKKTITEAGLNQLKYQQVTFGIGYLSAKIDQMAYRMTFDLARRSGTVVVNTSIVAVTPFRKYVNEICEVFRQRFAMGSRAAILLPGETIGQQIIPEGMVGFGTVCSVTLNGVLLKHGIPTASRFGGLLDIRDKKPTRFAEIIHYDATSIDPLEVFIRSGMTDYCGAISTGNGRIGASFREIPSESRELVLNLSERMDDIGLGAIMKIGLSGQTLLDTHVSEGRTGIIAIGGLNPVSILEENGYRIQSRAMSGLLEFNRLHHFSEIPKRLRMCRIPAE